MISDDARQYQDIAVYHALCWIHEIRLYETKSAYRLPSRPAQKALFFGLFATRCRILLETGVSISHNFLIASRSNVLFSPDLSTIGINSEASALVCLSFPNPFLVTLLYNKLQKIKKKDSLSSLFPYAYCSDSDSRKQAN